jgi:hypothetical protein
MIAKPRLGPALDHLVLAQLAEDSLEVGGLDPEPRGGRVEQD